MVKGKSRKVRKAKDPVIQKVKSVDIKGMKKGRANTEKELNEAVYQIVNVAQDLYGKGKIARNKLRGLGLLSIDDAYHEVKKNDIDISFRAFGGRIERKSIYSVKIGRKRYIPLPTLRDWVGLHDNYYTVRQAFDKLNKHEEVNLRAFIGRIEKKSIPSIKIGTQRWVPKETIDGLSEVFQNYYDVAGAMKELSTSKVSIKRNAFERRLDRGRIPHEKIGGRRFISKDVLSRVIEEEKDKIKRK